MCETLHSPRMQSNCRGRKSRSSRSRAKRIRIGGLRVSMHSLLLGLASTWWRATQRRQTTRSRTIIGRSVVLGLHKRHRGWCSLLRFQKRCSLFRGESVEMGPKHRRQRTWRLHRRPCRLHHRPCLGAMSRGRKRTLLLGALSRGVACSSGWEIL